MKKILNIMANRLFIVAVLILLQLGLIIGVMVSLSGFKLDVYKRQDIDRG